MKALKLIFCSLWCVTGLLAQPATAPQSSTKTLSAQANGHIVPASMGLNHLYLPPNITLDNGSPLLDTLGDNTFPGNIAFTGNVFLPYNNWIIDTNGNLRILLGANTYFKAGPSGDSIFLGPTGEQVADINGISAVFAGRLQATNSLALTDSTNPNHGSTLSVTNLTALRQHKLPNSSSMLAPVAACVVTHKIGEATAYPATVDNNLSRGTALQTALAAAVSGDGIDLLPATTYDLGTSPVSLPAGTTLNGNRSTITCAETTTGVLTVGDGCDISNVTVRNTATGPTATACIIRTAAGSFTLHSVTVDGDNDGLYVANCYAYSWGSVFLAKYDSINIVTAGIAEFYGCKSIVTGPSSGGAGLSRGLVASSTGNLKWYDGPITVSGGTTRTSGIEARQTAQIEVWNSRLDQGGGGASNYDINADNTSTIKYSNVIRADGTPLVTAGTGTITNLSSYQPLNTANLTPIAALTTTSVGRSLLEIASSQIARSTSYLNIEAITARGDSNQTLVAAMRIVKINTPFTHSNTYTLPLANTCNAGQSLLIIDGVVGGALTSTNTLVVARQGSDTINGSASSITYGKPYTAALFISDGTSDWRRADDVLNYLDIDNTLAANSDSLISSQKAVKAYVDGLATKLSIVPNTVPGAGQLLVGNAGGTAYAPVTASGDVTVSSTGAHTISAPIITTVSTNTGGWTEYKVTGSDATTTGQTLTDITGLVTGTLSLSSVYEFEAKLACTTSADTAGIRFGVHVSVAPTNIYAQYFGPTSVASNLQGEASGGTNADNIATSSIAPYFVTASEDGLVTIKGWFTTAGSGSPVFSIRFLKVTSGTATAKISSVLRIKKL